MKRQTKDDKFRDLHDAYKCLKAGQPVKRSGAKDGSIATHPVVSMPDYLESTVLHMCLQWLKGAGILCNRNNTGAGQMGTSGFYSYGIKNGGDIIGLLSTGQHFEIECKRGKGGRLSKGQQQRMRDVRINNGLYFVIHGVSELEFYFGKLI